MRLVSAWGYRQKITQQLYLWRTILATRCILGRSTYRASNLQCLYTEESGDKQLSLKINYEQYMNSKVKILGKRLYSPNLRDVAVLENVQSRFNFSYICLQVGGNKIYTNVWKTKNATERFLAQLHASNLVNINFCLVS